MHLYTCIYIYIIIYNLCIHCYAYTVHVLYINSNLIYYDVLSTDYMYMHSNVLCV